MYIWGSGRNSVKRSPIDLVAFLCGNLAVSVKIIPNDIIHFYIGARGQLRAPKILLKTYLRFI